MEKLLEGKVILITGGAQGLGLAMARGCARSGAKVIMADINGEKLAESAGALQAEGLRCEGVKLDVTDEQQIREVIAAAVKKHGRLDGLVNNAGITSKVKFLESTAEDFDRVINLNLRSVYLCCRAAAEVMAGQGGGAIVNIASVAARNGGGLMSTSLYAASKGGVISLTKGIARELAPYHIRVNAIAPGFFMTEQNHALQFNPDGTPTPRCAHIVDGTPMRRYGELRELIGAMLFLVDERAASFVTGIVLPVDGGYSAFSGV